MHALCKLDDRAGHVADHLQAADGGDLLQAILRLFRQPAQLSGGVLCAVGDTALQVAAGGDAVAPQLLHFPVGILELLFHAREGGARIVELDVEAVCTGGKGLAAGGGFFVHFRRRADDLFLLGDLTV